MTAGDSRADTAARTPPPGLPGLDPSWSRVGGAEGADGVRRGGDPRDTQPSLVGRGVVLALLLQRGALA